MNSQINIPARIGSIVIILFFSIFLISGGLVVRNTAKRHARNYTLVNTGMKGSGKVIDYKQTRRTIWPVVTYVTHDGVSVTFESLRQPNISGYSMGQTVPVIYDKNNPQLAEIDEPYRLWGGLAFSYFVGGLFMLVGGGAIIFVIKRGWSQSKGPDRGDP